MKYKNNLGNKLEVERFSGFSRTYKLRHELNYKMGLLQKVKFCFSDKPLNSLVIMSKKEIEDYIDNYYIKEENIGEEDLISDLITCKSYKEKLELSFKLDGLVLSCLAIFTSIIAIMMSVILTVADTNIELSISGSDITGNIISLAAGTKTISDGSKFLVCFIPVIFIILIKWIGEAIPTNKINSLNNAIYILESIKEDIEKNPIEIPDTKKFDIEIDNLEDQSSEPRKYSINVNEILEDKINEGTIESKNKSIEIKINL